MSYIRDMRTRPEVIDFMDRAGSQYGLITTQQADTLGLGRLQLSRLARFGLIERMRHGVYLVTGTAGNHQEIIAAWASLKPDTMFEDRLETPEDDFVATGETAAMIHGIGDLWAERHEFRSTSGRRVSVADIVIRKLTQQARDIEIVSGIPVLTVEATIADLVATGHELQHVADVYSDARDKKLIRSRRRLATLLAPHAKARGVLAETPAAAGSELLKLISELAS